MNRPENSAVDFQIRSTVSRAKEFSGEQRKIKPADSQTLSADGSFKSLWAISEQRKIKLTEFFIRSGICPAGRKIFTLAEVLFQVKKNNKKNLKRKSARRGDRLFRFLLRIKYNPLVNNLSNCFLLLLLHIWVYYIVFLFSPVFPPYLKFYNTFPYMFWLIRLCIFHSLPVKDF